MLLLILTVVGVNVFVFFAQNFLRRCPLDFDNVGNVGNVGTDRFGACHGCLNAKKIANATNR